MNKKIVFSFISALALFSGCGGSSGSPDDGSKNSNDVGTGYYIDSAVAGVEYKCGKESGVTASDGKFNFEKGKDCTFSVAGVELRKVEATKLADEVKIVEDKPEVAAFLQSIDIDGNPSNGIDIKPEVLEVLKEALKNHTTVPTDDNLTNVVNEVKNNVTEFKGEVTTPQQAMSHVKKSQESVVKEMLSGKTFYIVGKDDSYYMGEIKFNKDVTSDTWKDLDDNNSGADSIVIEGDTLVFEKGTSDENSHEYLYKTQDYLVFSDDGTTPSRLYYNKAKAEAYYKSLKSGDSSSAAKTQEQFDITQTMLNGKIFYDVFTEEGVSDPKTCYGKDSFTRTAGKRDEICYDESGAKLDEMHITFNYDIIDGKIRVDTENGYKWFTLSSQSDSNWRMINDDDDNKDGTIDSAGEINIWYQDKPANFPAEL